MGSRFTNPDSAAAMRRRNPLTTMKAVVVLFYAVGLTGLLIPFSRSFFLSLFPYFLFINAIVLGYFHTGTCNRKALVICILVFISAILVEAIGVKTGMIFGKYHYGNSLGLKIFETPVVIGINWLMLVYMTSGILERVNLPDLFRVLIASAGMLLYDVVLEQVAPRTDMWYWQGSQVPFQNYVAWFAVAVIFHSVVKLAGIRTTNPLSGVVFACQFLFFLLLFIFLR